MKIKLIKQVKYENGVVNYKLISKQNKDSCDFWGYVNLSTAQWISKKYNIRIEMAERETVALNFTPKTIKNKQILLNY